MRKFLIALLVLATLAIGWVVLSRDESPAPAEAVAAPQAAAPETSLDAAPESGSVTAPLERSDPSARERVESSPPDLRARIRGSVVRIGDNVRAPMARIEIVVFGGGKPESRTRTDADGSFDLLAEPGSRWIGAAPPNAPAWWDPIELPAEGSVRYDREFEANRKHCVRVWRREGEELVPVGGARVRLAACRELDAEQLISPLFSASLGFETSNDGRAQVLTNVQGLYMVEVTADGLASQVSRLDLSPFVSSSPFDPDDGCMHVTLRNEGPPVSGVVFAPDGTPLAGAAVFLDIRDSTGEGHVTRAEGNWVPSAVAPVQPPMTWTDEQGAFTLPGPGPEVVDILSAQVVVLPRRRNLVHHWTVPFDVNPRDGTTVLVQLPVARVVTLRIVDAEGSPTQGMASARDQDGMPHAPAGSPAVWLGPQHSGRVFPAQNGRVQLVHAGGVLRVGLSPYDTNGAPRWDPTEVEVKVPPDGDADVLVQLP